jgi:L-amino acid N-acyltransferase YncA
LVSLDAAGQPIGYAYASRHAERAAYQWSVDTTVYIREGHQRRGVGRALYRSLLPLLRLQGFYVARAGIALPNAASVGLHESFGFRAVGVYPAVGWKFAPGVTSAGGTFRCNRGPPRPRRRFRSPKPRGSPPGRRRCHLSPA